MIRRYLPRSVEEVVHWYERYVSPLSLVAGFLIDNFILLRRVDFWVGNTVLLSYLLIAALCIVLQHLIEVGRLQGQRFIAAAPFIPVVAQFAFGGLFSAFVTLYSRSAAFVGSWVFVAVLALLLVGNERFRRLYARFHVQVGFLFFALFSFSIFYVPIVVHNIGPLVFLVSGAISLFLISLFLYICNFLMHALVQERLGATLGGIVGLFIFFNAFYFLGVLPPLPLALSDAGVFHSIARQGIHYTVTYEPVKWYEFFLRYNQVFHRAGGEAVYVYSAVFAPSGIQIGILHEWQRYDSKTKDWVTVGTYGFPIIGGREGGYRGYSLKSDVSSGRWRVNVTTEYGQIIGRISFTVEDVSVQPQVREDTR